MRKPLDYLLLGIKGMGMGAADVVPGVSGGTIAFITGIYEELLSSIAAIKPSLIRTIGKEGIGAAWKAINGNFLVAVFAGIGISVVSLAKLFAWILKEHPVMLWSFFFGLILASIPMVWSQLKKNSFDTYISFMAGAIIAFAITEMPVSEGTDESWFIFVSGALAICAMILPGISGSFILLLLGMYQFVLEAVNERDIVTLGIFAAGCLIGLLSFARLLSFLFKRFHDITVALMAGFLLGSLNEIWPWKKTLQYRENSKGEMVPFLQENIAPENETMWTGVGLMLAGILVIFALSRISARNKQ